eukprot:4212636-Pyramimonas_sp.AAC.1
MNFVGGSCRVIRCTDSEDMRADEGKSKSLPDIEEFKGKHLSLWGSIPCAGRSPWQCVKEARCFRKR